MQTARVPNIEQKPRTASDTATHYGYCAFKDIDIAGGREHAVQPSDSPYYRILPARELIPFTNVVIHEVDELNAAGKSGDFRSTGQVKMKEVQKTARECAYEMADSYAPWGFKVFDVLTGFTGDDAFQIFQTVQPFTYKLKDLLEGIEGATERIEADSPYVVTYGEFSTELQPLRSDLKVIAAEVQRVVMESAVVAVEKGEEIKENTRLSMTSAFSGGPGKKRPDPLDKYVYAELGGAIPTILAGEKKDDDVVGKLVQALAGQKPSSDLDEVKVLREQLKAELAEVKEIKENWNQKYKDRFEKKASQQ